jgi:hypothetical protein
MVCHAQTAQFDRVSTLSVNQIPRYNSLTNATAAGSRPGNFVFVYDGADSGVHVRSFDNSRWIKINAGGGGGGGSYSAGNGIKIEGGVISWRDTIGPKDGNPVQTTFYNGADRYVLQGIENINLQSASNRTVAISNLDVPNDIQVQGYGRIIILRTDSLMLRSGIFSTIYAPITTTTGKYKVVLMDSTTGALVTATPALIRRQQSGTPTGTSDTQGQTGDMLFDDTYIYIKTSVGWKRTALSTF